MKQSEIKVGGTYYVKNYSWISSLLKRNQVFNVKRVVQRRQGVNAYYNETGQAALARELIPNILE
ncbi:hypothetical protein LCGC14_2225280 [marine sediment metagenome]|uniref:Uncharacterized protein n=1 Tax=marine sediment metagenome TaxID=412755 RepID=A0A0F9FMD5_9ZZZZ